MFQVKEYRRFLAVYYFQLLFVDYDNLSFAFFPTVWMSVYNNIPSLTLEHSFINIRVINLM